MTLEQKWDLIWPLACAVTHAIERFDRTQEVRDATNMMHMCRQLKKAVDHICPDENTPLPKTLNELEKSK